MAVTYCEAVSSEAGPLVILDGGQTPQWPSLDQLILHYPSVSSLPWGEGSAHIIAAEKNRFLIWDMGGAGTADIFRSEQGVVIVRAWMDEEDEDAELRLLTHIAQLPLQEQQEVGEWEVASGVICVLWSAEEGEDVTPLSQPGSQPFWIPDTSRLSMDGTALLVRVRAGVYECFTDAMEAEGWSACRCHLIRK